MTRYTLKGDGWSLVLGEKPRIMGIVNVTPDSFSDGGRFFDTDLAVAHGLALAAAGADILDVGGESTRPFSDPVSTEEEIRRVVPVIRALAARSGVPVSVDTMRAETARAALDAGARMINDVSALSHDPEMAALAASRKVPVVLMHMLGSPKTMQVSPSYKDVVAEVAAYLKDAVARALAAGIGRESIMVDPGIGFGKTVAHNLALVRNIAALDAIGVPVLVGHSRKAFIRRTLAEDLGREATAHEIETATQAVTALAIFLGAHVVRVHDVALARAAAILGRKILG